MSNGKYKTICFILIAVLLISFGIFYVFIQQKTTSKNTFSDSANLHNDCGPQALHSLLKQFNIDAPLEDIEKKAGTDAQGTTLLGLKKAAESYGLKAEGMRLSYDEMVSFVRRGFGVIAFIKGNHYVWVKNINVRGIVFKDDNLNFQLAPIEQWNAIWHGICLVISRK